MLYLMFKLTWITEKELEWVIENKRDEFCRTFGVLSPVQTDATLLANNPQHCWMLHVASVSTPRCMLLDVVACRCAKFDTGQTFQPTTPNISFGPWKPKRSVTMLDPFAQLLQHCWGRAGSLRIVYKDIWVVSLPRCTAGPNIEPPELVTNLPRVSELGKTQHFFKFRLRGPRVWYGNANHEYVKTVRETSLVQ